MLILLISNKNTSLCLSLIVKNCKIIIIKALIIERERETTN